MDAGAGASTCGHHYHWWAPLTTGGQVEAGGKVRPSTNTVISLPSFAALFCTIELLGRKNLQNIGSCEMRDVTVLEQMCLQWGWRGSNRNDHKKVNFFHNGVWHHNGVHHIQSKNCERYLTQRIATIIWPKLKGQKNKKCVAFVQRVALIEERRLFLSRSIQLQVQKCPIFIQSCKRGWGSSRKSPILDFAKNLICKGGGGVSVYPHLFLLQKHYF